MKSHIVLCLIFFTSLMPYSAAFAQERQASADAISDADTVLSGMNLVERIGQLLIIQLRYTESGEGLRELSKKDIHTLRSVQPGGVILFKENMDTVAQLVELIADINRHVSPPPFIAIDEEGGRVSRLLRSGNIPATPIPSARRIAASGNPHSAYLAYSIIGRELSALGFTMNFAPVADIFSSPENALVADRAFGKDPLTVSTMVAGAVRALREHNVVSVIKHFPGHGDSFGDSHFGRSILEKDLQGLMNFELQPFRAGVRAGAGGILMAHLLAPQVDSQPASFSSVFIKKIIRGTMNYGGLVITDALEMRGIGSLPAHEAGLMALKAGADMLLIPPEPLKQRDTILSAALERRIDPGDIARAARRILSVKIDHNMGTGAPAKALTEAEIYAILGSAEHASMLERALSPPSARSSALRPSALRPSASRAAAPKNRSQYQE